MKPLENLQSMKPLTNLQKGERIIVPDDAAKKLQSTIRRSKEMKNYLNTLNDSRIEKATQRIAGNTKALLTTKAQFGTIKEGKSKGKVFIANSKRVGAPLVVGVRKTLVGKKASIAAKDSEARKREFKELQAKYSKSGKMKP